MLCADEHLLPSIVDVVRKRYDQRAVNIPCIVLSCEELCVEEYTERGDKSHGGFSFHEHVQSQLPHPHPLHITTTIIIKLKIFITASLHTPLLTS